MVESGRATRGHRFLPRGSAGRPVAVRSFADLEDALRSNHVLLDAQVRRSRIMRALEPLGDGGVIPDPHGLVDEWVDLVEWPTVALPPKIGRKGSHFTHFFRRRAVEKSA